ncbi:MAG: PDZ domain-containing protein [Betaproteobacteria bacterium HGW-Betaproteobacteria-22]|nr:MAG: PDZ domain-containing protein [Betaproteobacteria bacterium HGW-Betaproteobacteria-22]
MHAIRNENSHHVIGAWLATGFFGLALLISTHQLKAAESNPFEAHYHAQNTSHLKSLDANPDTKIYLSNHKDDDNISMLESGHDLIGTSGFSAAEASPDLALAHAKAIKADVVLFYRKYQSAKTASSKIQLIKEAAKKGQEIDPNDLEEEPTQYRYFASYWAKLPPPTLGVHVIKLKTRNAQGAEEVVESLPGLKVVAVIKDSPAANAQVARGDSLLKIADTVLNEPEDLFKAVRQYAGTAVPLKYERAGETHQSTVMLNAGKP